VTESCAILINHTRSLPVNHTQEVMTRALAVRQNRQPTAPAETAGLGVGRFS